MRQRLSQFLYGMRQRTARFMAGRNGNDQFNVFLIVCELALILLSAIIKGRVGGLMFLIMLALLGYIYFRMLSRNIYRRQEENGKFLRMKQQFRSKARLITERWKQRKDYKFFVCPSCRATLRVPKGRGRIKIVCRKCGTSFTGKS